MMRNECFSWNRKLLNSIKTEMKLIPNEVYSDGVECERSVLWRVENGCIYLWISHLGSWSPMQCAATSLQNPRSFELMLTETGVKNQLSMEMCESRPKLFAIWKIVNTHASCAQVRRVESMGNCLRRIFSQKYSNSVRSIHVFVSIVSHNDNVFVFCLFMLSVLSGQPMTNLSLRQIPIIITVGNE